MHVEYRYIQIQMLRARVYLIANEETYLLREYLINKIDSLIDSLID